MAQTFQISDYTSFMAAVEAANPGDTIAMAAGNYGSVNLASGSHTSFTGGLTLTAQNPNNPPSFDSLTLRSAPNMTLSHIEVRPPATQASKSTDVAVYLFNTDNITLDNVLVQGQPAVNGVPPSSTPGQLDATGNIKGMPYGDAMWVHNSDNVTITNSDFNTFDAGIRFANNNGITLTNTDIHDLRTSPVSGGNVHDVVIDNNHFWGSQPWAYGGLGDHGDYIIFWPRAGVQNTPNTNITITNNFFDQADGSPILGVFLNNIGTNLGFKNVVISDNVFMNGNHQAIMLENVHNAQVTNNTILDPGDLAGQPTTIYVRQGSTNINIDKNIVGKVIVEGSSGNGVTVGDNLLVQNQFQNQSNYYGDLFNDWLANGADLSDLMALPGSIVDTGNYGASATQPDLNPAAPMGFIANTAGQGLAIQAHAFDLPAIYTQNGAISTANAQVTWDFGDGTTGSGASLTHAYTQPGGYDVTATVRLADGTVVVVDKTVAVASPVALSVDFDAHGVHDISPWANGAAISGNVKLVSDGGSTAAQLNGGHITYRRSGELFDNQEFSMLIDFRKDQLGDTGRILNFPGSFMVQVTGNGLQLSLSTDKGTKWLQPNGLGLDDTNWHQLALTFSGITGSAAVYLDGTRVAQVGGLAGALQKGNIHHDLVVGDPYGSSFTGLVDNVHFLSGALSDQDVAGLHGGSEILTSLIGGYLNNPNFVIAPPVSGTSGSTDGSTGGSDSDNGSNAGGGSHGGTDDDTAHAGGDDDSTGGTTGGSGGGSAGSSDDDDGNTGNDDDDGVHAGGGDDDGNSGGSTGNDDDDGPSGGPDLDTDDEEPMIVLDGTYDDDQIVISGGQIGVDTDDDGAVDDVYTVQGDTSQGEFMTAYSPTSTMVSFTQYLTGLSDKTGQSDAQINGIANTAYLSGDTAFDFVVDIREDLSAASFDNTLGVYEFDAKGRISDVRIIDADTSDNSGPIHVSGLDAGKGLGFFLVQNGYNRLDQGVLASTELSLEVRNGKIMLAEEGAVIRGAKVFVSHDAGLNFDGMEHVISGADPDGSGGLLIGFEDQKRTGENVDNDFQDVVFTVTATQSGLYDDLTS